MIRLIFSAFFLFSSLLCLYAEEIADEFKAAVSEADLFLKGGEYMRAARRSTEAAFLADSPESEGWDEAVRLSLEALGKLRASGKYPANPVRRIRIYRKYSTMLLLEDGCIADVFSVYAGPEYTAPAGRFMIGARLGYPNWEENGKLYPPSDPKNFLGARWMELITPDGQGVSGIHGSRGDPSQEPKSLFFTMDNKDVRRLFSLLKEGTVVEVE